MIRYCKNTRYSIYYTLAKIFICMSSYSRTVTRRSAGFHITSPFLSRITDVSYVCKNWASITAILSSRFLMNMNPANTAMMTINMFNPQNHRKNVLNGCRFFFLFFFRCCFFDVCSFCTGFFFCIFSCASTFITCCSFL